MDNYGGRTLHTKHFFYHFETVFSFFYKTSSKKCIHLNINANDKAIMTFLARITNFPFWVDGHYTYL